MKTNFQQLQSMSIDELAKWLDRNGIIDNSPWLEHFNNKYCANCESVMCKYEDAERVVGFKPLYDNEIECAYCEVHNTCRFFPGCSSVVDNKDTIRLWLEAEVKE